MLAEGPELGRARQEIQAHVRSRLRAYAYPRKVEFVADLPKTLRTARSPDRAPPARAPRVWTAVRAAQPPPLPSSYTLCPPPPPPSPGDVARRGRSPGAPPKWPGAAARLRRARRLGALEWQPLGALDPAYGTVLLLGGRRRRAAVGAPLAGRAAAGRPRVAGPRAGAPRRPPPRLPRSPAPVLYLRAPRHWDDWSRPPGLAGARDLKLPYVSADPWPRIVLELLGAELLILAGLLTFWPRSAPDADGARRWRAPDAAIRSSRSPRCSWSSRRRSSRSAGRLAAARARPGRADGLLPVARAAAAAAGVGVAALL